MKKIMGILLCALLLLGSAAAVYAQRGNWHEDTRMRINEAIERIDRGLERGSLTNREAGRLRGELNAILQRLDRMTADGRLSPREQEVIDRDLARLDQDITREKRDDEIRGEFNNWHGGIRGRIHEARQRIDRGIERGSLTRHEADRLMGELSGILERIDRMKADGHLSPREQEKISRDLDRLDRDIAREKNDDDTRGDRYRDRNPDHYRRY
jgi:hypothetical protein